MNSQYYPYSNGDAIVINEDFIELNGRDLITKEYYVPHKDFILDQLAKNYNGQSIIVKLYDAENSKFSEFENFLKWCCTTIGILHDKVIFETNNLDVDPDFKIKPLWYTSFSHALDHMTIFPDKNLDNAKFVGYTIGRMTIPRLRTAYELDKEFADDSYCEFGQETKFPIEEYYFDLNQNKPFKNLYTDEILWFKTKQFDPCHLTPNLHGWEYSYKEYYKIWNSFKIEVVPETDSMSSYYFSEKTGRCLVTGKPFVLIAGQNSLAHLRALGFKTFGSVFDETYDLAKYPYQRIKLAIESLNTLYNSPNRDELIGKMYKIAEENIEIYKTKQW